MTSRNDSSKSPGKPAPEGGGPKKPSALLDLKATEVSSSEAKPSASTSSGRTEASPTATSSSGSKAPERGTGAPPPALASASKPSAPSGASSSSAARTTETGSSAGAASAATKPTSDQATSNRPPQSGTASAPKADSAPKGGPTLKSDAQLETKPATAAKRLSGSSLVTHLTAGVAGGFLALLLADFVGPQFGLGNRTPPQIISDLQQRLAAAEQQLRARAETSGPSPAELQQRLEDVNNRLTRLDEISRTIGELSESQSKLAADTASLGERVSRSAPADVVERIAKLEQVLANLTAAAGSDEPGRIPQLAAISGKLADLESTIPNQLAELRKSVSEEIATRLNEIAEASEAARAATLRMDRELAATKGDLARLSQRAEALRSTDDRLEQLLRAVQEEAGSLRSAVEGLQSELASQLKTVARNQDVAAALTPVESRIATLEQSVEAVVRNEEDRRANAERIVLALELGNLKRALDRGGSYATELSELSRVAGGKIDLAALERYKDTGVPTIAALRQEFRSVAHAIIDAANMPADASALDRLLMGAKSIVRVRRIEHSPDDMSVEAIVARMEQALAESKFAAVLEQAKQLPPKALEPAEGWLAKVEARAAVDRAIASVEDQLKASLSGQAVEKRTQ